MDRDRYSWIAHASLDIMNPLAPAKIDAAIAAMRLPEHADVLDIGAGKGEILCRIGARGTGVGVAVERSALCCDQIRARAAARGLADRIRVVQDDAAAYTAARLRGPGPLRTGSAARSGEPTHAGDGADRFHACVCVGSLHALGDQTTAISTLSRLTRPGGMVLLGAGYWKRPPDRDYLAALGGTEDEALTHAGTIDLLASRGLEPLWARTASDDEWDAYEWAYFRNVEEHCRARPDDPEAPAMLARARSWRQIAQRWGRDTLGFGLYLARVLEA